MTFLELVKSRISVREYTSKEVEDNKIAYILECARLAPSAGNNQPWQFFVVKNDDVKRLIQECYHAKWLTEAPVYIVACSDTAQSWKRSFDGKDHADIDVAIAVEHICLAAAEQGLGTCWICNFDAQKCAEILNLSENIHPVAILLSDNAQKPVLNETMTNVEPTKLVYKVPKEVKGVVLQPDERKLLRNGKPILLTGMNGDNGEKFSSYVRMNNVKGQLDFYSENPDRLRHISRFAEGQNHKQQHDQHQKSSNKLKIA